ncbi:NifB/NifX family molybdenum-iron cluster-binding protein [[Clostridium] symbiosum]|mgnify:FL=1|uniref:NifB/NifX family molybdenum-iron cluster-binding protein n=1 Tax=Clostridium symbiosum TaxID=1512 RepID=UPI00210E55F1|nr:NifB/NifX family molybdenum-iron cluster-binding protein [[Clostridium] symbiosum]MCQ4989060.1 NifB/NifX family molybdenum-iron cluster-binding protein [[Clostridium] symbiosum]
MKIAVPYSDGQVFQHFGKSEQFKIYDTIDDEIISSEIVDTSGSGHSALVDFLKEKGAGVLICGGIGVGAVTALQNAGIQILGGAEGEADKCVEEFLGGRLHFGASGCASCSSSCGHHHGDGDEEECDGNISACGTWCH